VGRIREAKKASAQSGLRYCRGHFSKFDFRWTAAPEKQIEETTGRRPRWQRGCNRRISWRRVKAAKEHSYIKIEQNEGFLMYIFSETKAVIRSLPFIIKLLY